MSSKIKIVWDCPACKHSNPLTCAKPKPRQGTLFSADCKLCGNNFTMKVFLIWNNPGQISCVFIDGPKFKLSKKEIDELLVDDLLTTAKADNQGE